MTIRKNVTLDIDSALALMQEIYNDVSENRATASIILKKMMKNLNDLSDMAIIGPIIKEQQKILNDCTEKKLSLVKIQGVLLKQTNSGSSSGPIKIGLANFSEEEKQMFQSILKDDEKDKNPGEYKS